MPSTTTSPTPPDDEAPHDNAPVTQRSILVAVAPGQPDIVATTAIDWGSRLGAHAIHYVYVDPTMTSTPDGRMEPLDSDSLGQSRTQDTDELSRRLMSLPVPKPMTSDFTAVSGDPAEGLRHAADRFGSMAIVVGTRERGPLAAIEEWMRGSVSVRLEHIQKRPIIVIPLVDSYDDGEARR